MSKNEKMAAIDQLIEENRRLWRENQYLIHRLDQRAAKDRDGE